MRNACGKWSAEFCDYQESTNQRRHSEGGVADRRIPRQVSGQNLQIHKKANFYKFRFLFSVFRFPIGKKLTLFLFVPSPFFFSINLKEKRRRDGGRGFRPCDPVFENGERRAESGFCDYQKSKNQRRHSEGGKADRRIPRNLSE